MGVGWGGEGHLCGFGVENVRQSNQSTITPTNLFASVRKNGGDLCGFSIENVRQSEQLTIRPINYPSVSTRKGKTLPSGALVLSRMSARHRCNPWEIKCCVVRAEHVGSPSVAPHLVVDASGVS